MILCVFQMPSNSRSKVSNSSKTDTKVRVMKAPKQLVGGSHKCACGNAKCSDVSKKVACYRPDRVEFLWFAALSNNAEIKEREKQENTLRTKGRMIVQWQEHLGVLQGVRVAKIHFDPQITALVDDHKPNLHTFSRTCTAMWIFGPTRSWSKP